MALNNLVMLKGNLVRDPDTNNNGEDMITSFTLAVSKYSDSVDFIRCVAFNKTSRKLAEFIGSKARKGDFVHVMGSISTGSYINKDGQKVYTTDIIVDDFGFLESLAVKEARLTNAAQQFQEQVVPVQQAQQMQPVQQAQQVQPVQQAQQMQPVQQAQQVQPVQQAQQVQSVQQAQQVQPMQQAQQVQPVQQAQQVQPVQQAQQAQQVQPVQQGKVKKPRPQFTMNFGSNIGSSLPFQNR